MNLGEIGTSIFFVPYGVLIGILFESPYSASISYLVLTLSMIFFMRVGKVSWRLFVLSALLSFAVGFVSSAIRFP